MENRAFSNLNETTTSLRYPVTEPLTISQDDTINSGSSRRSLICMTVRRNG